MGGPRSHSKRGRHPKVRSEGVYVHAASQVYCFELVHADRHVKRIEHDLDCGEDEKLQRVALPEYRAEGNQDGSCAEVAVDKAVDGERHLLPILIVRSKLEKEAENGNGQLDGVGGDEVVEADACPAVVLEERHEEAEADKYHHVHVLEEWVELLY